MIIVIPAYAEPGITTVLDSLNQCSSPGCKVEVIIHINSPTGAMHPFNHATTLSVAKTNDWINKNKNKGISFHLIVNDDLPSAIAGVGLARKIGMDEAISRFADINNEEGIIVCLDADCTVAKNYLQEIWINFSRHPETEVATIYFEHPLEGAEENSVYEGIKNYELFLRYYIAGLREAQFPYAYHTVGSAMAVRAARYAKQGGMNKKKAGEDFYFLQKIFPNGNPIEINSTVVMPSPRASDRVPFGTGKSIHKYLDEGEAIITTYHPLCFKDLKQYFNDVEEFYKISGGSLNKIVKEYPDGLKQFLVDVELEEKLKELNKHSSNLDSFTKRFYNWFNGFKVLKYVHFATENSYPPIPVVEAAYEIIKQMKSIKGDTLPSLDSLLSFYRELDRQQ